MELMDRNYMIMIVIIIILVYIFLPIFVLLFTDLASDIGDWYRKLKKPKKTAKLYTIEKKDGIIVIREKNNP